MLWFILIAYLTYIAEINKEKLNNTCFWKIGTLYTTQAFSNLIFHATVLFWLSRSNYLAIIIGIINTISFLILILSLVALLPFTIMISIKTPECLTKKTIILNYIISSTTILILLTITIIALYLHYKIWKKNKKHRNFEKKLSLILKKPFSKKVKKINIKEFIKKNENFIFKRKCDEKILSVVYDLFQVRCTQDQKLVKKDKRCMCVICQGEFEIGDKFLASPGCKHPFHLECIEVWYVQKSECPICRTNVIKGLIEDIVNQSFKDFGKNNSVLRMSRIDNEFLAKSLDN